MTKSKEAKNIVVIEDQKNGKYKLINKSATWLAGDQQLEIERKKAEELINSGQVDIILKDGIVVLKSLIPIAKGDIQVGIYSSEKYSEYEISITYYKKQRRYAIAVSSNVNYSEKCRRGNIGIDDSIAKYMRLACLNEIVSVKKPYNRHKIAVSKKGKLESVHMEVWGDNEGSPTEYGRVTNSEWEKVKFCKERTERILEKIMDGHMLKCITTGMIEYINIDKKKVDKKFRKASEEYKGELI